MAKKKPKKPTKSRQKPLPARLKEYAEIIDREGERLGLKLIAVAEIVGDRCLASPRIVPR